MKVLYNEGVANHVGPGPCAGIRKGAREALVRGGAGQVCSSARMFDATLNPFARPHLWQNHDPHRWTRPTYLRDAPGT